MSEVRTVTFTTEEISEILRVAATGDQVWVCDKSVQLHRERNDSCCLLFHTAVAALVEPCSWARRCWTRAAV